MALFGAKAVPLGTVSSGTVKVMTGKARMYGFGVNETTGSATASFAIYDGEGSGGQLICTVNLAANESAREWWSGVGIGIEHGIAIVWVSGSFAGSVWYLDPYGIDPDRVETG